VTLESAIELIGDDELVGATPGSIRLRKRLLSMHDRRRQAGQREDARRAEGRWGNHRCDHLVHDPCYLVYGICMKTPSNRVNVILDEEHALKLGRLAERTHTNAGTIARSLLAAR
jgi:hypothetical protein